MGVSCDEGKEGGRFFFFSFNFSLLCFVVIITYPRVTPRTSLASPFEEEKRVVVAFGARPRTTCLALGDPSVKAPAPRPACGFCHPECVATAVGFCQKHPGIKERKKRHNDDELTPQQQCNKTPMQSN